MNTEKLTVLGKEELLPTETPLENIENLIFNIRGKQVMLDRDLARLYGVETKVLNQAVKRNIERFPEDFMFQLKKEELESSNNLRSQIVTSSNGKHGGPRYMPYVFTECGVSMLSIEHNQLLMIQWKEKTDSQINTLLQTVSKHDFPTEGIFHNGQIFDAYKFATDLIKSAKKSLVLIDNYVDESVLLMLSKREAGVSAKIYTSNLSKQLTLDLAKHNKQYPPIEIFMHTTSHDRFLIIDDAEVYHIGASLKDLGKKLFAFSRLNIPPSAIL